MTIQAKTKVIDMPDGVKALKIFSNEYSGGWVDGDDGPEASWDTFWVWGDDGCFYSYNTIKNRFDKMDGFLSPGTCVFGDRWNINYINQEGRLEVVHKNNPGLGEYLRRAKAINLELSRMDLGVEDVTGVYVSSSTHIVVADGKIFMVDNSVLVPVKERLSENFGETDKVRLIDGGFGVIIAEIPSPPGDDTMKPIIFRVSSSVFMISVDGGYTFFPFGKHPKFFFGNKVVFDSPVESWNEERYPYGKVTLINSSREARIVEERDVVNIAGVSEDVNLSDAPISATGVLDYHRGGPLTFLRAANGEIYAESCIGDKRGARIVFPTEIESVKRSHILRVDSNPPKGKLYEPSFAAIFKGGSTVGSVKFTVKA